MGEVLASNFEAMMAQERETKGLPAEAHFGFEDQPTLEQAALEAKRLMYRDLQTNLESF